MHVGRIGWLGSRVEDQATSTPWSPSLFPAATVWRALSRDRPDHANFTTGPVAGFRVDNLEAAVAALRAAGIELTGTPGFGWQHFIAPDGRIYELVGHDRRPARVESLHDKRKGAPVGAPFLLA